MKNKIKPIGKNDLAVLLSNTEWIINYFFILINVLGHALINLYL